MSLKQTISHLFSVKNTSDKYKPDFNHSNKSKQPVHMQSIERTMRHYSNIGNIILLNNLSDLKSVKEKLSNYVYNLLLSHYSTDNCFYYQKQTGKLQYLMPDITDPITAKYNTKTEQWNINLSENKFSYIDSNNKPAHNTYGFFIANPYNVFALATSDFKNRNYLIKCGINNLLTDFNSVKDTEYLHNVVKLDTTDLNNSDIVKANQHQLDKTPAIIISKLKLNSVEKHKTKVINLNIASDFNSDTWSNEDYFVLSMTDLLKLIQQEIKLKEKAEHLDCNYYQRNTGLITNYVLRHLPEQLFTADKSKQLNLNQIEKDNTVSDIDLYKSVIKNRKITDDAVKAVVYALATVIKNSFKIVKLYRTYTGKNNIVLTIKPDKIYNDYTNSDFKISRKKYIADLTQGLKQSVYYVRQMKNKYNYWYLSASDFKLAENYLKKIYFNHWNVNETELLSAMLIYFDKNFHDSDFKSVEKYSMKENETTDEDGYNELLPISSAIISDLMSELANRFYIDYLENKSVTELKSVGINVDKMQLTYMKAIKEMAECEISNNYLDKNKYIADDFATGFKAVKNLLLNKK